MFFWGVFGYYLVRSIRFLKFLTESYTPRFSDNLFKFIVNYNAFRKFDFFMALSTILIASTKSVPQVSKRLMADVKKP